MYGFAFLATDLHRILNRVLNFLNFLNFFEFFFNRKRNKLNFTFFFVITGIWKFLSRTASLSETNVVAELKRYFDQTRTVLGEKLFMELFFQVDKEDSYQDDLNELNRVSFLDDLHKAKELLGRIGCCFCINVDTVILDLAVYP